jgi:hypothetical protein
MHLVLEAVGRWDYGALREWQGLRSVFLSGPLLSGPLHPWLSDRRGRWSGPLHPWLSDRRGRWSGPLHPWLSDRRDGGDWARARAVRHRGGPSQRCIMHLVLEVVGLWDYGALREWQGLSSVFLSDVRLPIVSSSQFTAHVESAGDPASHLLPPLSIPIPGYEGAVWQDTGAHKMQPTVNWILSTLLTLSHVLPPPPPSEPHCTEHKVQQQQEEQAEGAKGLIKEEFML